MQLPGRDDPRVDILGLVSDWLRDESNGTWLLILDNADNEKIFRKADTSISNTQQDDVSRPSLLAHIPQTPTGRVLVTSRNRAAGFRVAGHHESMITIEPMDETDSLALFRKKTTSNSMDSDIRALLKALEFNPLAVTQAAAYISINMMDALDYRDVLLKNESNQTTLLDKDAGDLRRDPEVPNAVITTFQLSYEQIREDNSKSASLLSLMSVLNRQGIPESLLLEYDIDPFVLKKNLSPLLAFSLIKPGSDGKTYELHRLVQLAMRKWLDTHDERARWNKTALELVGKAFPGGNFENWVICEALLAHVEVILDYDFHETEELLMEASILYNLAWYFSTIGDGQRARSKIEKAVAIREQKLPQDDPILLTSYSLYGRVLWELNENEAADRILQQAISGKEKTQGPENPNALVDFSYRALIKADQGEYTVAEDMHRKALAVFEEVVGPQHNRTLTSTLNLSMVLEKQGKYEEAETLARKALAGYESTLGPEHPNTLACLITLGGMLKQQGNYEEAEKLMQRAFAGCEKIMGPKHSRTILCLNTLGFLQEHQGDHQLAEKTYRQAFERSEETLGPEDYNTLLSVTSIARTLKEQRKYEESEAMTRRALSGYEKTLGPEHIDTLTCLGELGTVLKHQEKHEELEQVHRQLLERREKILGPDHPDIVHSLFYLGIMCHYQRKYSDAAVLYKRAYAGFQNILGEDHATTIECRNDLTLVLERIENAHSGKEIENNRNKGVSAVKKPWRLWARMSSSFGRPSS